MLLSFMAAFFDVIAYVNQEKLRKPLMLNQVYNKVIALRTVSQQSKQRTKR